MPVFRFRHVPDAVLRAAGLRRNKTAQALALLDDRDRQLEDYLSKTREEANHGHVAPAGSVTDETTFGLAPVVGTAAVYSPGDHRHGTPANPVILATGIITETSYGQAPAIGVSTAVARADHTHGTPALIRDVYCEIGRNAVQAAVPHNTDTIVEFNVTDATSNTDLRSGTAIVIGITGRYLVWVSVKWAALNSAGGFGGYRSYHITVNGVVKVDVHTSSPETGVQVPEGQTFSRPLYLTAGDVVRVTVVQTHSTVAGTRDLLGGDAISPILGVKLLDP